MCSKAGSTFCSTLLLHLECVILGTKSSQIFGTSSQQIDFMSPWMRKLATSFAYYARVQLKVCTAETLSDQLELKNVRHIPTAPNGLYARAFTLASLI